jgi:hypothetical protein
LAAACLFGHPSLLPHTQSPVVDLTLTSQEVEALALKQPPPRDLQQRQMELLRQGVEYVYRAQQLVSGIDPATQQAFGDLKAVVQQVQEGAYRPRPQAGGGGAAAAGGDVRAGTAAMAAAAGDGDVQAVAAVKVAAAGDGDVQAAATAKIAAAGDVPMVPAAKFAAAEEQQAAPAAKVVKTVGAVVVLDFDE